jgi:LysM repeat protein
MKKQFTLILSIFTIAFVFSQTKPKGEIKSHKVAPKETVYSICKQYGITVQELVNYNPAVAEVGLQPGQILKVPYKGAPKPIDFKTIEVDKNKTILHEVLPKETKYAIAKKYNITIQELEKLNPEIVPGLQIGAKLYISGKRPKPTVPKIVPTKIDSTKTVVNVVKTEIVTKVIPTPKTGDYVNYQVKPQETLYGLSKMFSLSQENLIAINPELANGVQEGMTIKVPKTTAIKSVTKKEKNELTKFIKGGSKKQLALLLPFNLSKIQSDTIITLDKRLKKDGFLNMTLDFYAGALIAIDSAKTLGMNIDVKILDSKETKTTSNVENLVADNNLKNFDAIIGPFYKVHSDKTAELVDTVPVISPLSKDSGNSYKNSYLSMPSSEFIKDEMFDFMTEKNGNIVAVIDPKKTAIKQYISENQKETKLAKIDEKGNLVAESLKNLLVKDKTNYVVLVSEKTAMILSTTKILTTALKDFDIRLVILENNQTLDFDEIEMSSLTKLKLTYPSLSRDNNTTNAKVFETNFKRQNKTLPNIYATRGFDITFDTMMRLSQNKSFENTIVSSSSEQVESKFDYSKKVSGGYINKGVFILQYNDDLTITEAQ